MPMVEHTGETIEDKPSDVSQILLDYGWVIPAAAAAGYGVKKAADTVQGIKGRKQKPVEAVPQEDIIDVTAREVTPTEKPFSQAKQLPAPTQTVAAPATQAAPAAPGPVAPPAANWSQAQVSMPPVAPPGAPAPEAAPKPVDPLQEARIRKANAEAAMAEHKLQQLQSGVKTTPASKTSAAPVSEAEMQMIQKSGAASASKELQAMEAANKIAPAVDPIQATATPAEKQAAVQTVASEEKKKIQGKAGAAIEAPEGRIPSYPNPKRNKQGADVIGQGGWHWYQGQMGPEAEQAWLQQFGRTNQSYDAVKQAMKEGRLPSPVLAEGKKGGAFPRETTVPNYIKGNASMKGMLGMLAGTGLLGIAGSEKGKEAMSRAASAISDLGISPDIFAGKGEELGKLGKSYITAGNPNYIREIRSQLEVENNPERRAILQEELQKAGGSGAGRGIAPPAAYLR